MKASVKEYYGKILSGTVDLKTNACCTDTAAPDYLQQAMSNIHAEVSARYYGCGLIAPQVLPGADILDLGSGSGRDCYVLAQLVGENGSVVGVDMTEEQLEVANTYLEWHREKFGYAKSNVEFKMGHIERLDELGMEDSSFDIIVSNCVINLSPDKEAVLKEAYRLLKPGGELYFSDVYSDRRVPEELLQDPLLYSECLSGALYWNDFLGLATGVGFADPRLVEDRPITMENPDIEKRIGHINFYSATYRLFKIEELETTCEDYGQAVVYTGGIANSEQEFVLDSHTSFEKGSQVPVCGNTYLMLHESRFRDYFEFYGSFDTHYGIFEACGTGLPFSDKEITQEKPGSCC
jgi:SAM-dependent methyltransferase